MRQVVLDTETTGLEVAKGHRVIEIGCIELLERRPSGRRFHAYVNPGRAVDEGARAVHGISDEFLADKPGFASIAEELSAFLADAELVAHNASFDIGFLDNEFALAGSALPRLRERCAVLDTLQLAREKFPGQQNNLNALCRRLGVDIRHRELHGALVDAQLLADVYLAMTAGQGDLGFSAEQSAQPIHAAPVARLHRSAMTLVRANPVELALHEQRLATIDKASGGACLWKRIDSG